MVWDGPRRLSNLRLHGPDVLDGREYFHWSKAGIAASCEGRRGRPRFEAVGLLDGRIVTVIFAPLGSEAVSLMSLRSASKRERRGYANTSADRSAAG